MEYLKYAEAFTESKGNLEEFKSIYIELREHHSVDYSVWKALSYLYGPYVADMFELSKKEEIE